MISTLTAAQYRALPKRKAHRVIATPLDGKARESGQLALSEVPPSLNNAFVNGVRGRYKSARYRKWGLRASIEFRHQPSWHVPGPVALTFTFSRPETRADLDNLQKGTIDALVCDGRISDDRNVVDIHARFGDVRGVLIGIMAFSSGAGAAPFRS